MLEPEKLQDPGFIAFTEMVNEKIGAASIEVLYAWYFNTITINKKQTPKKDEGENK